MFTSLVGYLGLSEPYLFTSVFSLLHRYHSLLSGQQVFRNAYYVLCQFFYCCLTVCVCVWLSLSAHWASTRYGCQSCLWSAQQGKRDFLCPRSRLRVWSCNLGSAVPSHVSPLILHTKVESSAYLRDSTSPPRFRYSFR